jgi:predicted dehydrogenase
MSQPINRRYFIQNTAAAAAMVAGSKLLRAQSTGAKPAAGPATTQTAERVNLAFVGVMGKARDTLNKFDATNGANVVALCDVDGDHLGKAAEKYPKAKTYSDFRKMLEQKDIDGVVVTTPDHTHAPAALMAMALGKGVYCEKPLTHNIAEARKLTEAARKHKVTTQMGNHGHSGEGNVRQVEWAKSGMFGTIREVHCWTNRPIWPQGVPVPTDTPPKPEHVDWDLWLGPAPERAYHPAYHPFKWRGWWDFGTGALGDMACHLMDGPYWALDLRDPISVEAISDGNSEESAPRWSVIKYQFPDRPDRPGVTMFWYDGGIAPNQRIVGSNLSEVTGDPTNSILYVGDKGKFIAEVHEKPNFTNPKEAKERKGPEPFLPRSIGHHKEFLEGIKGGKPCSSNFDYSGPMTEMVLLGNLAVRTGKRVEWDAKNMRATNVPEANQYVSREYRKGWEI